METKISITLDFYNKNSKEFIDNSFDADISVTRKRFTDCLKTGAFVLDLGCGSGRDSLAFLKDGFKVEAVDGSVEIAKAASLITGLDVKVMLFDELDAIDKYDGIWACACLLHLETDPLKKVIQKIIKALKPGGIFYASFKYGDFYGIREERFYNYMNEERFSNVVTGLNGIASIETWRSDDSLRRVVADKWFNILIHKEK